MLRASLLLFFALVVNFDVLLFSDTPGIPVYINNTVNTITIRWSPINLQSATYTINIRPDDETVWKNATCKESIWPKQCTVISAIAEVLGLEGNSLYRFRVYANFQGVKDAASSTSDAFRTAGDVGLCNVFYVACKRFSPSNVNEQHKDIKRIRYRDALFFLSEYLLIILIIRNTTEARHIHMRIIENNNENFFFY